MSPSTGSGQPISIKIPPPPSDSASSSGPYSASSANSGSSADSPKVAPAAYRRHSRKRSSQVLIPPIQAVRRRQGSGGQQPTQESDWEGSGEDDGVEKSDSEGEYVDMFGRRRSVSVNAVASGATFLIGAQLFSKALTFILNQALLRFVGPGLFGASAQLEFFINTILYFSREAVRLATQRKSLTGVQDDVYRFEGGVVEGTYSGTTQQVVNIGFVAPMIGAPLAGALAYLYYKWGSLAENDGAASYFGTAIVLFSVSAIIELLSEPCFVLSQLQMEFRTRAAFESAAITVRCVLTFVFVLLANASGASIIAFALGQLAYSSILSGLYLYNALSSEDSRRRQYTVLTMQGVWPADGGNQKRVYFDPETRQLAVSIWLQTIFKHCLSEGDKFLVSLLLPITDQGVYAVVLNYGSLIARLVFLPVEDALRNYFSKTLSGSTSPTNDAKLSVTVLSTVLRIYTYVAILALTFGPTCAPFLLKLLVSKEWTSTDAPGVLATYACYIPFLAYNGTLEALVQSVASPAQIKRQGTVMVVFSVSFALAAYILMGGIFNLGARGLIYASMLNMTMRIVWCINWIEAYYRAHKEFLTLDPWQWLKQSIPSIWTLSVTLIISPPVMYQGTVHTWPDLSKDVFAAVAMLAAFAYSERSLILKGLSLSPSTSSEDENRPNTGGTSSSDSK